ncbi:MAG TPA: S8 family serine peptidase [Agriterribacter sp.]|nr:S8 family serine peptidase [Agriterribacter sp.]
MTKASERNRKKRLSTTSIFNRQWYLQSGDGSSIKAAAGIEAMAAWAITKGNPRVTVAIIDEGFDLDHPDLNLPGKIIHASNYNKTKKSFATKKNVINHGTMCAGIALAKTRGNGMLGIANGCSFMPVCIPPDADDKLLVKVFEETAVHADVICCCWGPPPIYHPISDALHKTLTKIAEKGGPRKKGTVICFSASNYNAPVNNADNNQFFWLDEETGSLRITKGPILNGYAAHPSVIAVSASTSLNQKAAYSNWGKEISVCAPANNFHPIVEASKVKGRRDVWTTGNNGYTRQFGGTSAATALVAGVAALVLSINPNLNPAQVKKIIEDTADKIEDPEPDIVLGNCMGTYCNGHSWWFGYGKVNAGAAVMRAKEIRRENKKY